MEPLRSEGWPTSGDQVDFGDLVDPVVRAIRTAYALRRRPKGQDIEWTGPMYGWREASSCGDPRTALSAEWLLHDEEQGRDALDTLVGIAVRLGMEQGRRGLLADRVPFLAALIWAELSRALHAPIDKAIAETFALDVPAAAEPRDLAPVAN
jgi:hypothetical protein